MYQFMLIRHSCIVARYHFSYSIFPTLALEYDIDHFIERDFALQLALHARALNERKKAENLSIETISDKLYLKTSRGQHKSAPYPRLKNSKRFSKCQVFSLQYPKKLDQIGAPGFF